jgi:hypothetical protein
MDRRKIGWEIVDFIHVVHYRDLEVGYEDMD